MKYLNDVVNELNIAPLIRYNTEVIECRWNESECLWYIKTRKTPPFPKPGEEITVKDEDVKEYRTRFLLLGTGVLSLPKMPAIPGMEEFKGPSCHSAKYNLGDLTGKVGLLRSADGMGVWLTFARSFGLIFFLCLRLPCVDFLLCLALIICFDTTRWFDFAPTRFPSPHIA